MLTRYNFERLLREFSGHSGVITEKNEKLNFSETTVGSIRSATH